MERKISSKPVDVTKLSPMMRQYWKVKEQYLEQLLFFRLGDFYELFFDDALIASRELELTLTGKECGLEERAPMCGIPYHSSENYIAKLVKKGYKVAICEQMEDPATAKGLVKREIIRVITPGTVLESNMLDAGANNYLCMIYREPGKDQFGLAFSAVSTGEVYALQVLSDWKKRVTNELGRFSPAEVLLNSAAGDCEEIRRFLSDRLQVTGEVLDEHYFVWENCRSLAAGQFGEEEIEQLEKGGSDAIICALGAMIQYLTQTQKHGLESLTHLEVYSDDQYMTLDLTARRNLELTKTLRTGERRGTLLWVLDQTRTPMGKRLIRAWIEQPLLSPAQISRRLNAVEELSGDAILRGSLSEQLTGIYDLERLMSRIVYGSANGRELRSLAAAAAKLPGLKGLLKDAQSTMLSGVYQDLDTLDDVLELIDRAIVEDPPFTIREGGIIKPGYSAELDELKGDMSDGKGIIAQIEAKERERTGIPKLKVGYNRVFGYYIEITNAYKDQAPPEYIRKQTLTNCERYITPELKELENKILGANERLLVLEHQLFADLLSAISAEVIRIQRTASAVAQLDVLAGFAEAALQNNYVMPTVDESGVMEIREGRHPVIEQMLKGSLFVPNDTLLDEEENRMLLITGPNMAGKSTYMRQNALIALMAQIGSFVPAASARIGVVDAIFTRVGASDDLAAGQSTFMVEMTEVAEILKNATKESLVILDEIGRGTSTFDGMSIARSVVEFICENIGCKTLFATHYHELTSMEQDIPGVKNYNIAVKKRGEDITFLRRIVAGPADDSYGIEVAKLAGLPGSVTRRAHAVLRQLEASAPGHSSTMQLDFETVEAYNNPSVPSEVVDKLHKVDIETLTPLEALNFLYELKNTLDKD